MASTAGKWRELVADDATDAAADAAANACAETAAPRAVSGKGARTSGGGGSGELGAGSSRQSSRWLGSHGVEERRWLRPPQSANVEQVELGADRLGGRLAEELAAVQQQQLFAKLDGDVVAARGWGLQPLRTQCLRDTRSEPREKGAIRVWTRLLPVAGEVLHQHLRRQRGQAHRGRCLGRRVDGRRATGVGTRRPLPRERQLRARPH